MAKQFLQADNRDFRYVWSEDMACIVCKECNKELILDSEPTECRCGRKWIYTCYVGVSPQTTTPRPAQVPGSEEGVEGV